MTTFGGPVLIDGPIPQAPPFNLLNVATLLPPSVDEDGGAEYRWGQGGVVRPYPADVTAGWDMCSTGSLRTKGTGIAGVLQTFAAFTVWLAETCTARGIVSEESFAQRAVAAFGGLEHHAVEQQILTGNWVTSSPNPFIADINCTFPGGVAALSPNAGLEFLENAIGATARKGVIHADPATVSAWSKSFLVYEKGNKLVTANGTPVVSGTGYIGAKPTTKQGALTARQSWAFASGPVMYDRADGVTLVPGSIKEALARSNNVVTYRAERDYLVVWDGQLQAAVLIDRSL